MESKRFKNFGHGVIVSILALSSLGAFIFHSDVIAGNGGGNGGGNANGKQGASASNAKAEKSKVEEGYNQKTYEIWFKDLIAE